MYNVKEESTSQALSECIELGRKHNEEVIKREYNPNRALLDVVLKSGLMFIVTVRMQGKLVGYWLNMVTPDFISGKVLGKEAAIYLSPEARGSSSFIKMVRLVEKISKEKGAVAQMLTFEEGYDTGLAQRLGYAPLEHNYIKELGDS